MVEKVWPCSSEGPLFGSNLGHQRNARTILAGWHTINVQVDKDRSYDFLYIIPRH